MIYYSVLWVCCDSQTVQCSTVQKYNVRVRFSDGNRVGESYHDVGRFALYCWCQSVKAGQPGCIIIWRGGARRVSRARLPPAIIVSIMRSALCPSLLPRYHRHLEILPGETQRHLNKCLTVTDISSHHTLGH